MLQHRPCTISIPLYGLRSNLATASSIIAADADAAPCQSVRAHTTSTINSFIIIKPIISKPIIMMMRTP